MEIIFPAPAFDFNFDSPCSSPFMTAPSSPQRFPKFFFSSAPTSPSRSSLFFSGDSSAAGHFPFEEIPKNDEDFAFQFTKISSRNSLSAEELFDCGKIRPLKSPAKKDLVSSQSAIKESSGELNRGRERISDTSSSNSTSKKSRSLSPLRVSDIIFDENSSNKKQSNFPAISSVFSFSSKNYRKWKFKDFLLFRSASEGRATRKDPFMKYEVLSKRTEDLKNSSFRSTDSGFSGSNRRGTVSAHEMHYKVNRAVKEEMKRKTFLPYKQGLLGCLGFNHGLSQISRGIGSLTRG